MLNFKKIQSLLLTLVLILNLQISKELDALFLKLKSDACQITFQGKRNFYNSSDDQCYPMVECSPDQIYDEVENVCLEFLALNSSFSYQSYNYDQLFNSSNYNTVSNKEISCVHGNLVSWDNITSECICDSGYTDSTTQFKDTNSSIIYKCDLKITSATGNGYMNYSDSAAVESYMNDVASQYQGFSLLNIKNILLLIGCLVILCCIGKSIMILKRKRQKKKKRSNPREIYVISQ